ncbi:cobaltochelatase CobN subunit [Roseimicrobium gellanilyticum]|uniref:Cobaltochelatase CobN subunit n=1 Tax=Roseimicrobium gellanilyticum TaxID=748857 RepID=A0A366HTL3_9BACT|nr:cobaltochelatase subunit CobN [Roseimicrobium gellanilyticum]RBP47612.1 cobaltochelatase CobN subunit [Roseimicrobium gellanilyticum]
MLPGVTKSIKAIAATTACLLWWSAIVMGQAVPSSTKLAFVGVWERSMPLLDQACREHGVSAGFYSAGEFAKLDGKEVSAFPVVLVLNIDAASTSALTAKLKEAHEVNAAQKVLSLDTRDSQVDLEKQGLLVQDPALRSYWRGNGPTNVTRMIGYCGKAYLGLEREVLPPIIIPEFGYYAPEHEDAFTDIERYREFRKSTQHWKDDAPVAVLVIQQSFWITRDLKVVNAQMEALERHGLNPVVIFGDSADKVNGLIRAAKPAVLIEDRHGSNWNNGEFLKELDIPYLRPVSMLGSTVEEWQKNPRGLSYQDVGLFMSLQEYWGTVEPMVVGGLQASIQGFRLHEPIPDRVEAFAARAANLVALRTKKNPEKKIAIIYYNKGLGQDDLMRGSPTGAFLDGPESLVRFLPRLQKAGYAMENLPATAAELIETLKKKGRNIGPWAQGDLEKLADEGEPSLIPLRAYQKWFDARLSEEARKAVVDKYGPPPGRLMVVKRNGEPHLVIPRIQMGNVILTPQPERGHKQDDKLLHSRDVPPPHSYLAFYWWLEEEFGADAILHWGTHGSLELLPGKENGLSKDCWSDVCVSRMPVVNLWITDNLAEATVSRRRSYATLVDHRVPPALTAGLSEEFKTLHDDIHKFNTLEPGLLREEFRKGISEQIVKESLELVARAPEGKKPFPDEVIARVDDHLHHLYDSQTPTRLHILGQPPTEQERLPYLTSILGLRYLKHLSEAAPFIRNMEHDKQMQRDAAARLLGDALEGKVETAMPRTPEIEKDVTFARDVQERLMNADSEITGLIHALDGGYTLPGPGPDPIRNSGSLPTGRNLYSLNPEEIPNRAAWEVGCRLVNDLLRDRKPKKIGMDLTGMETMCDYGVMEAQILFLLGVRPVWDHNNLVNDVELIPMDELKRPRVDVFIAVGGDYKETFGSRMVLLDKAVRLAAAAKEEHNPVRDAVAEMETRLHRRGFSSVRASQFSLARIFGTKPGNMTGTHILYLVPRSGVWENQDEITSVYTDNMSYVYSGEVWGEKVDGLYEEAIQGTDTILRVWASNMTSQLTNHHSYEYFGGLSMAVKKLTGSTPQALIADVRNPDGASIRDLEEVLATNLRSELLGKKWLQGMKDHDYAGAGHIAEMVKNTFGWSVTRPESVSQQTWTDIYEVVLKDRHKLGLEEWFEKVSPHAMQEIAATLLEAARKGVWQASEEQIADITRMYADSVARHGDSGGLVSGGNVKLATYAAKTLISGGEAKDQELAKAMQEALAKSSAAGAEEKVVGQKLENVTEQKQVEEKQAPAEAQAGRPTFNWSYLAGAFVLALLIVGFFRKSGSV